MGRIFALFIVVIMCAGCYTCWAEDTTVLYTVRNDCPPPDASASLLMEKESGAVLFSSNSALRLPMASTTKIMTAIIISELLPLDRVVCVPKAAVGCEGSSIYLYEGEKITVEELLYGLMLESANDAATALAIEAAGSVESFALLMNKKAEDMGLCNTNFTNPHGLDHMNHYTTAHDLGVIASYALDDPVVSKVMATKVYRSEKRTMSNHNRMLSSYKGAVGGKTGYTIRCGRCLVSCAQREGMTLIGVTLNCRNDWKAHTAMLDWGFENYQRVTLVKRGELRFNTSLTGGESPSVSVINTTGLSFLMDKGAERNISYEIKLKHLVFAPVAKEEMIGKADFYIDGRYTASVDLVSCEDYQEVKKQQSFWQLIWMKILNLFKFFE